MKEPYMAIRTPRGYVGAGHQTIGSDILSLPEAVLLPDQVMGRDLTAKLRATVPNDWYPISTLLEPLEMLGARLGSDSLRRIGIALFKLSHEAAVKANAKSARDVLYGMDTIYHRANRGTSIGGWKMVSFDPGRAVLEKTTPHHCVMEEGIIEAALRVVQVPAMIRQTACLRDGSEACTFVVTSHVTDARWNG